MLKVGTNEKQIYCISIHNVPIGSNFFLATNYWLLTSIFDHIHKIFHQIKNGHMNEKNIRESIKQKKTITISNSLHS